MKSEEMDAEYTKENPDLRDFDLGAMADLGAFYDGSGGGIRGLAWEMKKLREEQERIDLLHSFVRRYQLLLARLCWNLDVSVLHPTRKQGQDNDIGVFAPQISLCSYAYDKQEGVTAQQVAALWPNAEWRRSLPRFGEDESRDYTADVDGVVIRIKGAEKKPAPKRVSQFSPCGPIKIKSI